MKLLTLKIKLYPYYHAVRRAFLSFWGAPFRLYYRFVRPSQTVRLAIVESSNRHDEVLPSLVSALNKSDIEPILLLNPALVKDSALFSFPELRYQIHSLTRRTALWAEMVKYRQYDAVILNSAELLLAPYQLPSISVPTLAIFHNPQIYLADPENLPVPISKKRWNAAHLAPLERETAVSTRLYPASPKRKSIQQKESPTLFLVQGNIDGQQRRQYDLLFSLAKKLQSEKLSAAIKIVGRCTHPEALSALQKRVVEEDLSPYFVFCVDAEPIPYAAFLKEAESCSFILPLLNPIFAPDYYRGKLSSSIPLILSSGLIPVVDEKIQTLYRLPGVGYSRTEQFAEAAIKALYLTQPQRETILEEISQLRSEWETKQQQALTRWIENSIKRKVNPQ